MTKPILLSNALLYRGNAKPLVLTSLLIEAGLIKRMGERSAVLNGIKGYEERDLAGGLVIPGIVDAHLHIAQLAPFLQSVNCEASSKETVLKRVHEKAKASRSDWLVGFSWNQNDWDPPEFGNARELDAVSEGKAVVLHDRSLHAAWANSNAMQLAGISKDSADPEGGRILKDSSGEPTGIFLEDAVLMLQRAIPEASAAQMTDWIDETQTYLHSLGITGIHDFDRFESYEALKNLEQAGKLSLRIVKNLPAERIDKVLSADYRSLLSTKHFRPGWIKGFADGALGPQSAAMLEPYEGSDEKGLLTISREEVLALGVKAQTAAWPLTIHAIGDSANHEVIEGYRLLRAYESQNSLPHLPHRIEHVQCITPEDQAAMKELGIIASVQPTHATSDMFTAEKRWGDRCAYAYAYRNLLELGIPNVYGSDAPVESANPFLGIHAAVTRRKASGEPNAQGWYPSQKLSLMQALDGFGVNANRVGGFEDALGLEEGSAANLVLVDRDLFEIDPQEICQAKPLMTMVDGIIRYEG